MGPVPVLGSAFSGWEMRAAAVVGEVDVKSGFRRGPSWWWMLEYRLGEESEGVSGSKRKVNMNGWFW